MDHGKNMKGAIKINGKQKKGEQRGRQSRNLVNVYRKETKVSGTIKMDDTGKWQRIKTFRHK